MKNRIAVPAALAAIVLLALACTGGGTDQSLPPDGSNVLQNPGLEDGRDPWFSLKPPDFVLSKDISHSGEASALLQLRGDEAEEGTKIGYLVQEISPEEMPQVLSGYYRVENWTKGTKVQYLQVVVIAFGVRNLPGGYPNHQIRYILAGIDSKPFEITNARFVFLSREDPPTGRWVKFERDVRRDFEELWGAAPQGFDKIRMLFEVRYDAKSVGEGPVEADVYYDDLYFGPGPGP
jgi:hypothetical protein